MPAFEFSYYDIARYVANNCDSEQMIGGKIDETFVVGNLREYLEKRNPLKRQLVVDEQYIPDEWREKKRGRPRAIDMALVDTEKDLVHIAIEVKFLYDQQVTLKDIVEDLLRLGSVEKSMKSNGRKLFLLAGLRWRMEDMMFKKEKLGKILKFPEFGRVMAFKPLKIRSDYTYEVKLSKMPQKVKKALVNLEYEGQGMKFRITSIYRPNFLGYQPKDKNPKHDDYVDVGIWEIISV